MRENQKVMSKEKSTLLYGVAVLLMLFHHLFKGDDIIAGGYLSIVNKMVGRDIITQLAWFGKICVAIFAFISGYGLSQKYASLKLGSVKDVTRIIGSMPNDGV